MTEEKDDFLREIDELLQGDLEVESEEPLSSKGDPASLANVSNGVADLDLNSIDSGLTVRPDAEKEDSNHVPNMLQQKAPSPPKTGYMK